MPIYVLKSNTMVQMENMLASLFDLEADPQEAALRETAEAIGLVQASGRPLELAPQNAYVRRLQHQMAERNALMSRSRGSEPNRRVELLPEDGKWRGDEPRRRIAVLVVLGPCWSGDGRDQRPAAGVTRGRFITLEGPEGSGKTTAARHSRPGCASAADRGADPGAGEARRSATRSDGSCCTCGA